MAKYDVTYSCGHKARIELFGKEKDRQNKIEYFERHGLCKDCFIEKMQAEEAALGLVLEVDLIANPLLLLEDGYSEDKPVRLAFTGDTYPHKDHIKALGGYRWERLMDGGFLGVLSTKEPRKAWIKYIAFGDIDAATDAAAAIGATIKNNIKDFDMATYVYAKGEIKKEAE